MGRILKEQKGFSLIEVSILLIIVGLLVPPWILLSNLERKALERNRTVANFHDLKNAIQLFVEREGRYPIPADIRDVEGSLTFGEEVALTPPSNCGGSAVSGAAAIAGRGWCKTPDGVLIGGVPFDDLGIDAETALDYWNNKILYAVTESQTVAASTSDTAGGITVWSYDYDDSVVPPTRQPPVLYNSNFDMVLISFGKTGLGAYTNQGVLAGSCDTTAPASLDSENCDYDSTFFLYEHADPNTPTAAEALVDGASFYDDLTAFQATVPFGMWFENQVSSDYAMTTADIISIGTKNPDPNVRIHVEGDIQAGDDTIPANHANLQADTMCDVDGQCFEPELIGGVRAEMDCNKNALIGSEPIVEIGSNQVFCGMPISGLGAAAAPLDAASGKAFALPTTMAGFLTNLPVSDPPVGGDTTDSYCFGEGELVTGINAAGVVQCEHP